MGSPKGREEPGATEEGPPHEVSFATCIARPHPPLRLSFAVWLVRSGIHTVKVNVSRRNGWSKLAIGPVVESQGNEKNGQRPDVRRQISISAVCAGRLGGTETDGRPSVLHFDTVGGCASRRFTKTGRVPVSTLAKQRVPSGSL